MFSDDAITSLRARLVSWLRHRGYRDAEEIASEVILRLCQNKADGVTISKLVAYTNAIAKNIILEWSRRRDREASLLRDLPMRLSAHAVDHEQRLKCMNKCLDQLPLKERLLLLAYTCNEPGASVASHRKLLAQLQKISENALRIKVSHIIKKVRACCQQCMKEDGAEK